MVRLLLLSCKEWGFEESCEESLSPLLALLLGGSLTGSTCSRSADSLALLS